MSTQELYVAGGCFWGIETALAEQPGVLDAESGYAGGETENPTYEEVCGGRTGHAETVKVVFDSETTEYEKLVRYFFTIHNPTELNRQGPDVGTQYRSAIFYKTVEEKEIIERVISELSPNYYPKSIATEVAPFTNYYKAEEYHQDYAKKHPSFVCHI